jgi:alpha-1,2-mannosyltransferase
MEATTARARSRSSPLAVRILLVAALPVVLFGAGIVAWLRRWPLGVDSSVYRDGAVLFLHRQSLYSVGTLGYHHLPFTYPPAAALLFTPLAALPGQLAWALMASASLLGLALVIRLAIARVPYWRFPPVLSTVLLTAVMLCLVPVWSNLGLGQINILLMAMVTTDVLLVTPRGSRWGGVLIGLAAAVKLVPLIFIPYLLITGKRAAAARAAAVFVGLQGLMLVIAPQDSGFWTSYMFHTGRIGPTQFSDNQSLAGLMERVTAMSPWYADAAWAVGAVIAVPAVLLVLRYHRRGQDVSALCVTAGFGLLLSPVTWVAGWVWVTPVVVAQLSWLQASWRNAAQRPGEQRRAVERKRWARAGLVIAVIAVFTINFSISPQRQPVLGWFWFFVLSNPYVVTAIAVVLVLSALALRRRGRPELARSLAVMD